MENNLTWKSAICTVLEHLLSNNAKDFTDAEFISILESMKLISHKHGVNRRIDEVIMVIINDRYSDKLLADLIECVRDYD